MRNTGCEKYRFYSLNGHNRDIANIDMKNLQSLFSEDKVYV